MSTPGKLGVIAHLETDPATMQSKVRPGSGNADPLVIYGRAART